MVEMVGALSFLYQLPHVISVGFFTKSFPLGGANNTIPFVKYGIIAFDSVLFWLHGAKILKMFHYNTKKTFQKS